MAYPRIETTLTPELIERASKMRESGDALHHGKIGWRPIAKVLGVSERALLAHFEPEKLKRIRASSSLRGDQRHNLIDLNLGLSNREKFNVPPHVLEDRERRLSIIPDPVAEMLGDPLFCRSALYQKLNRNTGPAVTPDASDGIIRS